MSERDEKERAFEAEADEDEAADEEQAAGEVDEDLHGDPLEAQGYGEEDFSRRDYSIPGVDADDTDPYKWHTGKKRDHGGEDAIEIIDLVKQFGRTRILNGCNLGLPDNMISMVLNIVLVHIIGMLGTLVFWGANPRAPIGG